MRRVLVLACLVPTAAHAAPTQLNQIPTTDLVPVKQVSLQLQNGNTEVSGRSSVFHQPQLLPQAVGERHARLDIHLDRFAVDLEAGRHGGSTLQADAASSARSTMVPTSERR